MWWPATVSARRHLASTADRVNRIIQTLGPTPVRKVTLGAGCDMAVRLAELRPRTQDRCRRTSHPPPGSRAGRDQRADRFEPRRPCRRAEGRPLHEAGTRLLRGSPTGPRRVDRPARCRRRVALRARLAGLRGTRPRLGGHRLRQRGGHGAPGSGLRRRQRHDARSDQDRRRHRSPSPLTRCDRRASVCDARPRPPNASRAATNGRHGDTRGDRCRWCSPTAMAASSIGRP